MSDEGARKRLQELSGDKDSLWEFFDHEAISSPLKKVIDGAFIAAWENNFYDNEYGSIN